MPVLVGGVGDDDRDDFGFEAYDMAEVDRLDAGMVLSARWRGKMPSDLDAKYAPEGVSYFNALAPFSRQFPGLAPPAGESLSAGALRQVLQDYPAVRIALIPARRGAEVLPLAGWNSGDDYRDYEPYEQVAPAVWAAAVVRSWEDRFGVRLLHVTGAEIRLLVQRPPVTREHAELVAAEHFAFATNATAAAVSATSATSRPRWSARRSGNSGGNEHRPEHQRRPDKPRPPGEAASRLTPALAAAFFPSGLNRPSATPDRHHRATSQPEPARLAAVLFVGCIASVAFRADAGMADLSGHVGSAQAVACCQGPCDTASGMHPVPAPEGGATACGVTEGVRNAADLAGPGWAGRRAAGRGGGLASRALSWAWLLAGQVIAVLGVAYLTTSARLGWQSPSWTCARFLSRPCQDVGMQAVHDIKSTVITAVAGVAVLAFGG